LRTVQVIASSAKPCGSSRVVCPMAMERWAADETCHG
jgi:hypothetical protein